MDKIFEKTENTRIIGKRMDGSLLVTNDPVATFDDIYALGAIIEKDGKISVELPIGVFTKAGYWEPVESEKKTQSIAKDSLLGFAVGDAFGVPVEFLSRKTIRGFYLDDMVGYGSHKVPAGAWSDDTSMLVATMDSMVRNNGKIDYDDIMKSFLDWLKNANYTSIDTTFGVGGIIYESLKRYIKGTPALECGGKEFMDNGNGSLMRILPVSLYCVVNDLPMDETRKIIDNASQITHAHDISKMCCFIYTEFLRGIFMTRNKQEAFYHILGINYSDFYSKEAVDALKQLLNADFMNIEDSKIKESGYVVDTLESVIYSILNTNNYEDSIKTAVNLGYDTDTVAGITGSISGMLYGSSSIPKKWLSKLKKREYLEEMAQNFEKVLDISNNHSKNL